MNSNKNGDLLERLRTLLTKPLSIKEIMLRLGVERSGRTVIKSKIRALAETGAIIRIRGARYGLPEKMNLVTGTVLGKQDGYGFILSDDPDQADVFIGARNFGEAMHGDRVVCRVEITRSDGKREGRIIRVLERAHTTVAGTFAKEGALGCVIPFDTRLTRIVNIPSAASMGARPGQAVVASIVDYPSKTNNQPQGKILEILGDPDDPQVEIKIVTEKFHIRSVFPPNVVSEAGSFDPPGDPDCAGRLDLRHRPIVTIDGETAKDFDDAVEVEKLPGDKWKLSVSIADVSHYVKEGSALDVEALERGNSVYFPGSVVPMLPFKLSNEICSLNPKVDRLALSLIMTIDKKGAVIEREIRESVIRTVERMTYTGVAAILEGGANGGLSRYGGLVESFRNMERLASILRAARAKKGAIDFGLPEPEVVLDMTGRPDNIIRAQRNVAHRIIEEFMLLANKTVAEHLIAHGHPAIFRAHEKPEPLQMDAFREFIAALGFRIGKKEDFTSATLQKILDRFAKSPEEKLVTHVLLRSMKQARYTTAHTGHFALAFKRYTHFTSPIRRYADLVTHRALKSLARKKKHRGLVERFGEIAEHCSKTERNAEEAERDIIKLKQTQYMAGHVGTKFHGVISGVTSFGFFVELEEPAVEGLVRLTSLHDDYYKYKEAEHALYGERTGKRFRLGDKVAIRVANVSPQRRQIDFEWAGLRSPQGKKGGPAAKKGDKRRDRKARQTPKPRRAGRRRKK